MGRWKGGYVRIRTEIDPPELLKRMARYRKYISVGSASLSRNPSDHRWLIAHRNAGIKVTIGYVEAPDEDTAIVRAIGKFNIDPRLAGKLIAEKTKTQVRK